MLYVRTPHGPLEGLDCQWIVHWAKQFALVFLYQKTAASLLPHPLFPWDRTHGGEKYLDPRYLPPTAL